MLAVRMDLAWTEFEPLRDAFINLSDEWSNRSVTEPQPDGVSYLIKARPGTVDPLLRVKTGAVIHQVRATLDNLAWGLAVRVKRNPLRVSFPIATSAGGFANTQWAQVLSGDPARAAVEALQPYNRVDARCLRTLHRLWNQDKHRVAPILPVIPARATFVWKANASHGKVTPYWSRRGKTVHHDDVLAKIVMPSPLDAPPKGGITLCPALDIGGPLTDRVLPQALFDMYRFVRDEVMPALDGFL